MSESHEIRITRLEENSKTDRVSHVDVCKKVKEMHYFLVGDNYDQQLNGGFLKQIKDLCADFKDLKDDFGIYKTRTTTRNAMIAAGISLLVSIGGLLLAYIAIFHV